MINSVYIHIPFCSTICTYCDFCKLIKNDKWINEYLNELECEIKDKYKGDIIKTLYIGGGTPSSLNISQLKKLFNIIKIFKFSDKVEFTFECNIESIDYKKLKFLYNNKVNRLSIGIQTFNQKYLKYLNRNHNVNIVKEKINIARNIGFKNINVDLMYAFKDQTLNELNDDLDKILALNVEHISTYSLMIEPHTILYIKGEENIDEDLDYEMYKLIIKRLKKFGYKHYEISNFAKNGKESKHNLTYWNNNEYYGFGLGASGYIKNVRYDNVRILNNYLDKQYVKDISNLSLNEKIENEFILGFRKIKGINKSEFKLKYNIDMKDIDIINKLLKQNQLKENKEYIYINPKYIYISNNILVNFIDLKF